MVAMGKTGTHKSLRLLILGFLFFIDNSVSVTVDDGSVCVTEPEGNTCPTGMSLVFKDIGQSVTCCDSDKKSEKDALQRAMQCRPTKCVSGEHNTVWDDVCFSSENLPRRVVSGNRLQYDSYMEHDCGPPQMGGSRSLCCPTGSTNADTVTNYGAEHNEFPHMAKLTTPGFCGATVYNKRFLITAAHCVVDDIDGDIKLSHSMKVTLGVSSIDETDAEIYRVKRVIPHEDYSKSRGNPEREHSYMREFNDIALLEVDRDIEFSEAVKAIEIAPRGFNPPDFSNQAVVVGWGREPKNFEWTRLQKTNFILRNSTSCFDVLDGYWWVMGETSRHMLCLGGIINGTWGPIVGRGDGGGPAVCRDENGLPVLCGIVSFGAPHKKCLDNDDEKSCPPSVFTDVSYFHDWIVEKAGEQEEWTLHKAFLYGREVPKGMYENQVRLTTAKGKSCGGTLVQDNLVVTAAQCVSESMDGGFGDIHEGILVTTHDGKRYQTESAAHFDDFQRLWPKLDINLAEGMFTMSDKHKLAKDYYHRNDLAVVKLIGHVRISPDRFARLPRENEEFSEGMEVAFTRTDGNGSGERKFLDREIKILGKGDCRRRLDRLADMGMRIPLAEQGILCGIEKYSGGSTCDRELGGGLICRKGDQDVLCGVQIFRFCERSYPLLFMDLGAYSNGGRWIRGALSDLTTV